MIGTERHESRRIDNQLRGRSGRQGDPGCSRFFLSLEDDLMRIYGGEKMGSLWKKLGMKEGEAIVHPWLNKALERAQKKVEARNFDLRKNILKYDDVMNDQRKEVYQHRREYMAMEDVSSVIEEMRAHAIEDAVAARIPEKSFPEQWESADLESDLHQLLALDVPVQNWAQEDGVDRDVVSARVEEQATQSAAARAANIGPALMRSIEKQALLTTFDSVWKEHLHALDQIREGIGLRAYGQRDPLNEYKHEAFNLFSNMLDELRYRTTSTLSRIEILSPREAEAFAETRQDVFGAQMTFAHDEVIGVDGNVVPRTDKDPSPEISSFNAMDETPRNAPCPCGSGKKFKHCHGRLA
ncbi:Protein translocase subunit SecA [Acetobacteraceae bacterium EV16G]|uniref:Preprotein translocase subunit SecA n=1 Tax=Sorlinia euscelidii TaxID=3081148 RepID=A0ABU7U3L9_9PROT